MAQIAQTVATDPGAAWLFLVDQLNPHQSETLVRCVAQHGGLPEDLGVKGQAGLLRSMATRAACLQAPTHRLRFVSTPTHAAWLNPSALWFSLLVRRLLKRASFASLEERRTQLLAVIADFNRTLAKPFRWPDQGRPLTV